MSSNIEEKDSLDKLYDLIDDLKKRDRYYALTMGYGTYGEYTDCICKDHKEFVKHILEGRTFYSELFNDGQTADDVFENTITPQNELHIMYDIHKVTKTEWNNILKPNNEHHRLCEQMHGYWDERMPDHYWIVDYNSMIQITSEEQFLEELEGIKENGITDYPE